MFNKRIGLCDLTEVENRTMVDYCEDSIFYENVNSQITSRGSEEGFLADTIMIDHIFEHWYIRLAQIRDDNPMLWALMLNQSDYWCKRFQSLDGDLRREV